MQASAAAVPWQEQRDPFVAQVSLLVSWFVRVLYQSRLHDADWRSKRKTSLLSIAEQFKHHHETWLGDELRRVLERLLSTYVGLFAPQAPEFFDWYSLTYREIGRKVGKFPLEGHPSLSYGANKWEATESAQVRDAARKAGTAFYDSDTRGKQFENEFCSDVGVSILKLRRLPEKARELCLREIAALPGWPSPTSTMLYACDRSQPASSRLARFKTLVDALLLLYWHAVAISRLPNSTLPLLEAAAHELANLSEAGKQAFGDKDLAVQVSAVDHARDVLFAACEAFEKGWPMRDGRGLAKDLQAAFHGVAPEAHAAPHEPLVEQSLGVGRA
ncbi:hypothetical protein JCM3775_007291 [Rhodotorula graminis]